MAVDKKKTILNVLSGAFDVTQDVSDMVDGPASSTDSAVALFDSTSGKLVKNSTLIGQGDGRLTLGADATGSLDAVTKQQLDNAIAGVSRKEPVEAATTAEITLSGLQTVDGISLVADDRVLVKNQTTNTEENGIYVVAAGAWSRSADNNSTSEMNGAIVVAKAGTVNADRTFEQTANDPVVDTDPITWIQAYGVGTYAADGNGIEESGGTFSLELDGSTLSKSASGLQVAAGGITNTEVNATAAIQYSKLNLAGSILNTDINASAAIAYSKLDLAGNIVNTDINASAAIAYSKLDLAGNIVNADISASASIEYSKLASLTSNRALISNGSGAVSAASVTNIELNTLAGINSNVQNQLDDKVGFTEISVSSSTLATDMATHLVDSSGGAISLNLPAASGAEYIIVKDFTGSSETFAITLNANGGETIDGQLLYVMESNYESVTLASDGSNWYIV